MAVGNTDKSWKVLTKIALLRVEAFYLKYYVFYNNPS